MAGNRFFVLAKPEVIQSLFLPRVVRELTVYYPKSRNAKKKSALSLGSYAGPDLFDTFFRTITFIYDTCV